MFSSIFAVNENKLSGGYCRSNIGVSLKLSGRTILPSHHCHSQLLVKDFIKIKAQF